MIELQAILFCIILVVVAIVSLTRYSSIAPVIFVWYLVIAAVIGIVMGG